MGKTYKAERGTRIQIWVMALVCFLTIIPSSLWSSNQESVFLWIKGAACLTVLIWAFITKQDVLSTLVLFFSCTVSAFAEVVLGIKTGMLACMLLQAALIIFLIVSVKRGTTEHRRRNILVFVIPELLLLRMLFQTDRFSFVDRISPLWIVAIAVGLALAVVVCSLYNRAIGQQKMGMRIGLFFLAWLIAVIFVGSTVISLNYILDPVEPQTLTIVIQDKDEYFHRKSPDTYEFKFFVGDERRAVKVPRYIYRAHEVGDEYKVHLYQGAFGVPFYLADAQK